MKTFTRETIDKNRDIIAADRTARAATRREQSARRKYEIFRDAYHTAAARREIHAFTRARNIAPLVKRSAADLATEIIDYYNMPWWDRDDNATEYDNTTGGVETCIQ